MVNHKEILRLKSLGLAHQEIAASCGCGRNTVTRTLARAREQNLSWDMTKGMSPQQVTAALSTQFHDFTVWRGVCQP